MTTGATARVQALIARAWQCVSVAAAGPVLAFGLMAASQAGVMDRRVAFEVLVATWGVWLALIGVAAALLALVIALRGSRRAWLPASLAVVIALGSAAGFGWARHSYAEAGPLDVTTNPGDQPGYNRALLQRRSAAGGVEPAALPAGQGNCDLGGSIPTQVAPETAAAALRGAGFEVLGYSVARADGTRQDRAFGFGHDAVVRIRPGQTDVRVTARELWRDGGATCRLARKIVQGLTASL
ncbi:MAG: hypothetical protein O9257_06295 [Brevundimonas sp.]|nr:hypothetical protein [Brevundimonas sp.]